MRRDFGWCPLVSLVAALLWPPAALATPPRNPITLEIEIPDPPRPFEPSVVTIRVTSIADAPGTEVELLLPEGIAADQTRWTVDLEAGSTVVLSTRWTITGAVGNVALSARAHFPIGGGSAWGNMKSIPLHVGAARSQRGWRMDFVPVAELAEPGDTQPLSLEPTRFPRGEPGVPARLPAVLPERGPSKRSKSLTKAGSVTLTGRWQYQDRGGVFRNIDQQVIEIRRGDGGALSPRVYCYTSWDGTFSCTFTHPGTTLRVWVRSWTNFTPGPTRLGVFQGVEIPGGCGSDNIDCSYPVQTGVISCASGATCDVGTWIVSAGVSGEPWLGAHQMEQDLIRSWKRLHFDFVHPAGSNNPGPARITYPVPAGHGTHIHIPGRDPWISIEPPNQQSADIVTHEYGHGVMSNLWAGYSPRWTTSDCPRDHFIHRVSGAGCALSEGFADFWAWYSNEFYDGDGSSANDGPVFNWPGGASTNMETRDGGTYDAGDRVEGNVAAAMGDFHDAANDGPASGPADRLSDGIQHIWHTTYSQSDNNFSEWWSAYWATFSHDACPARDILHFNTINYSTPACGGGGGDPNLCQATANCFGAGGGSVSCSGTTGDCFAVDDCYAYCDGQYHFCPSPPGVCPL